MLTDRLHDCQPPQAERHADSTTDIGSRGSIVIGIVYLFAEIDQGTNDQWGHELSCVSKNLEYTTGPEPWVTSFSAMTKLAL